MILLLLNYLLRCLPITSGHTRLALQASAPRASPYIVVATNFWRPARVPCPAFAFSAALGCPSLKYAATSFWRPARVPCPAFAFSAALGCPSLKYAAASVRVFYFLSFSLSMSESWIAYRNSTRITPFVWFLYLLLGIPSLVLHFGFPFRFHRDACCWAPYNAMTIVYRNSLLKAIILTVSIGRFSD